MRYYIALVLLLTSLYTSAQAIKFHVQGTVQDSKHAKFAYLTTLSHQVPISSSKIFMVSPITNGKFDFKGTFDPGENGYQHACVFVEERGNISKEEMISKFNQLILVVDKEKNFKHIILENIGLDIQNFDQVKEARIVSGGKLTTQLHEWFAALRAKDGSLLKFVKKYPASMMSLDAVFEISQGIGEANSDRIESYFGSPKMLYASLSEQLKKSKKGIALKKRIDNYK
ncbi:hypothetical protein DBR43_02630 [Pedobacter sp. KBW06]|uniref:DUF4369 domain-containing protein n=1 Tax=Pedobacter sp. KBW06 TaxID=2153359 RepID=UPI000F59DA78|nr:DUF4369 domain-containing protein [Pedobacter sp. KBW06]RQO74310.1 hypothetical protein DBR43_02630 [Pedobacter sp. KBW06]